MNNGHEIWVLLVGLVVTLAAPWQALSARMGVPALVGYLPIGLALRAADDRWHWLGESGVTAFGLLADLGIVLLLFHVGLRSRVTGLLRKLRPAALVWAGNTVVAGSFGYVIARHALDMPLVGALTVGVALTATSITVSAAVWDEAGALRTPDGELMMDVAELDDISGVALMALLFAVAPTLADGGFGIGTLILSEGARFVAMFAVFAAACVLLARHVEPRLSRIVARLERPPQRMLTVAGAGLLIAAIAATLGFSLAIGAVFAGLVFSRDPAAVRTEARLDDLQGFLVPFFFIGVGMQIDPTALADGVGPGAWLLAAAVAGKLLGAALPAFWVTSPPGAALLAVSLVPRAEIALVIAQQGLALGLLGRGDHAALVSVSAATCLVTPWLIRAMLRRWPVVASGQRSRRRH